VRRTIFALIALILLIILAGCNLGTAQDAREVSLYATQTAIPLVTPATDVIRPTPLLLPNGSPTAGAIGGGTGSCGRLRVDVGDDPGNTLRLREAPNNNGVIILLIPNNTLVDRVAGSPDVAADGYNWINIRYTDPNGVEAVGWAARDAIRDRVTLRQETC
jgi:hypothetical protein